ncbi:DUF4112 domain-containing protein [Mucilaginibacter daejeonensis]|uniref:DUF4112 domain-containing protein n=1 Tax=Mucilaginibacter daejeonensis TaxID=398049 RepID=UPI001D17A8FE|nr:DUF4112 domain-containing protein [Mucilaginibacter daejeonensis]UEG53684.1 DUF4112 domain-containing protein [Mucilaginibacter daejeonensis]
MPARDLPSNKQPVILTGRLKWVERIAHLFDDQFRIPGTNFRFGLDPIINLFPVAGDAAGMMVSAALLITMARNGASRKVIILMLVNVLIDGLIGAIPLVGQVFDFYYKANLRNIKLLKEHYEEGRHQGSGNGVIAMIVIVLVLFLAAFVYLSYWLVSVIIHAF